MKASGFRGKGVRVDRFWVQDLGFWVPRFFPMGGWSYGGWRG